MKNIKDKLGWVAYTLVSAGIVAWFCLGESSRPIEPVYRGDLNGDRVLDALLIEPIKDSPKGPYQLKYVDGNDIYLTRKGTIIPRKSPTGNLVKMKNVKPIKGGFTKVNPELYKTYDIISAPDGGFMKVNPKSSLSLEVKDVDGDSKRDIVFYKGFNPKTIIDILYNIDKSE